MKSEKEIRKELQKMRKRKKDAERDFNSADNLLAKQINRDVVVTSDAIIAFLKWVLKK